MPPQTRSSDRKPAAKITYTSTGPAPKQQLFPHRRRTVKTYGRSRPARKDPKQGTLTQMDFTSSAQHDMVDLLADEEEDIAMEAEEEVKPKRKSRGTRRKTAGDVVDREEKPRTSKRRKTLGDVSSTNASSSFHTQTLTQFLSNREDIGADKEDVWQIDASDEEADLGLVMETPKKRKNDQTVVASAVPSLVKSVTPSNRQKKTEIPSSQSPTTPMILRFDGAPQQSPLTARSTNIAAPSSTIKKYPRNFVVQDSYSTTHSSPTTPTAIPAIKGTPLKKIRFKVPEDKENITPGRTKPKSPKPIVQKPGRRPLQEVPDSDEDPEETEAETEDEESQEQNEGEQEDEGTPCPEARLKVTETHVAISEEVTSPVPVPSDPRSSLEPVTVEDLETTVTIVEEDTHGTVEVQNDPRIPTGPMVDPAPDGGDMGSPRRSEGTARPATPPVVARTSISSPHAEISDANAISPEDLGYTQALDSQRVPLDVIHSFGPQTGRSDIMVSLHPEHVTKIVDRSKDHEFRAWKIPLQVTRVWLYITKPVSELKYMCLFGPAKEPGEIQDERGIGNKEFNQGKMIMKFAYEILQVYELNNPVSLEDMKNKGWVSTAPQKYTFIPQAVVGELTSNLRCALFEESAPNEAIASSSIVAESQEARAQLQSDVDYSTQHPSSDHDEEIVPSSRSPRRPKAKRNAATSTTTATFARPPLPAAQSSFVATGLPPLTDQPPQNFVRPSQATTVSQESSPAVSPVKSNPPVVISSSQSRHTEEHGSSPTASRRAHSSLRSSQFPTRSQMLPDSLLNAEIQEPPAIIWDSADELSD
ncbi:hypothetical protein F4780DRAFT_5331 [Xylariomycetidae sp. FL0641]|nr:hypothetical protein F4780DRAFT_5331 [Xylariomycetidae sp. FL0641]